MRIGIDCRLWATTTGRYIRENIRNLIKLDAENEYVIFLFPKDVAEFKSFNPPDNYKIVEVDIPWHSFEEQLKMPSIALRQNLDLFHVPYINVPIFYPKKFVVTIHDLTVLHFSTGRASTKSFLFHQVKRLGYKIALLISLIRSYKVITVSHFVKQDILKTFKVINPEKIKVIHNGVSLHFSKKSDEAVKKALAGYNIKKPYIFYVGNAHPHKNVEKLLRAFEKVHEKRPELQLVLGGKKDFFWERLEEEFADSPAREKMNFVGFVDDEVLPEIFTGSEAYVTASMFEGFGLQTLESMACGTRVITSNTTSLPEVGGDVAYYFDPGDVDDIAGKILKALKEPKGKRVEEGYERINGFTWEESARKHLEVFMNTGLKE